MIKRTKSIVRLIAAVLVASNLFVTGMPSYSINAYAASNVDASAAAARENGLTEKVQDGAILHAWCWSFNTIKENMADIAAAGFSAVQTPPANNCLDKYPTMKILGCDPNDGKDGAWWWHYQPTDWKIGNYQVGTRDEFKAMCDEADKYGIKVIVDVVPNHTTPTKEAISQDFVNAVGGWDELYHENGDREIREVPGGWDDRYTCTTGKMNGLIDVNTENPRFQKYFLNYLNDCIDCGADGFRYDTAKHIGLPSDPKDKNTQARGWDNNFWPVVSGQQSVDGVSLKDSDRIFNYGEILQAAAGVKEEQYSKYIYQTASNYGENLRNAIRAKDFSVNKILDYSNPADPSLLVTWVESHDTYWGDCPKSHDMNDWQIRMAWAVIAARKDGTPLFYNRPDGSNSPEGNRVGNNVIGAKGNNQFKEPEVVEVNKFRNAMVGESEYLRNINGSSQILAIERGKKGEVIVNLGGQTSINYDTTLADGTYKDQVSERQFTVSNGKISGQLDGGKVAVIYNPVEPIVTSVSAQPGKESSVYSYSDDTVDVTLNSSNVTSAKYSIDGKSEVSYTNGTKITIGADKGVGESTTLKLTGVGNDGKTVSKSYTYKEVDDSVEKAGIYFKKPAGWGNNINVYVYDEKSGSSVQTIAQWPGTAMTSLGNDEYFFELPESWKNANTQVIFSDGSNQTPGARQPGLEYSLGKAMKYEDGVWKELKIKPVKELTSGNITTDLSSPQKVGTSITINTEEATGGSGNYTYEFKVNGTVIKSASSDKSVVWTPKASGTYTITVTSKDSKGQEDVSTKTFVINDLQITKEVQVTSLNAKLSGSKVVITANAASKSNNNLVYKFYVHEGINGWKALTDFTPNNETIWTPSVLGNSIIWVEARDNKGNKDIKFVNFSLVGGITK